MAEECYKPCKDSDISNELFEEYYNTQQYEKYFEGYLSFAKQGYTRAQCHVGFLYYKGIGIEKDYEKALYWSRKSAYQKDRNAQFNLGWFYEHPLGAVEPDIEQAKFWYKKSALQNNYVAIQKCRELGVDFNAPLIDRETIRKDLQCRIFPLGYLEEYKYTVICSNYEGKWILSRHKNRVTWETQGGHIEDGETPLACAKRELFEESGIEDADIYPVCDYWGFNSQSCSNVMVFLAVVYSLGELPQSEMKEIKAFDTLPSELTYPHVLPKLYDKAQKKLEELHLK